VQLIEALGGGWDASTLPTSQQIISRGATASSTSVAQPPQNAPAATNP
jgi:hypothetical protein